MITAKEKAKQAFIILKELGKTPKSKNINDILTKIEKEGYEWSNDGEQWLKKDKQYISINVKADPTVINELMECIIDAIDKLEVAELELVNKPKVYQAKDMDKKNIEGVKAFYLAYKNNSLFEELDLDEDLELDEDE